MDILSLIAIAKAKQSGGGGGGESTSAVTYTPQQLTTNQKTQARENIGAGTYSVPSNGILFTTLESRVQDLLGNAEDAVMYTTQSLSDVQQARARDNIDAVGHSELQNYATTSALDSCITIVNSKADQVMITTATVPSDGVVSYELQPNTIYILDGEVSQLTLTAPSDLGYAESEIIFQTGDSTPNIMISDEILLPDYLTFKANMLYEIDVFNSCAAVAYWNKETR